MRQLRVDLDAAVATRRHRTLPVQRVRTLRPHERTEQTASQAAKATRRGEAMASLISVVITEIRKVYGILNTYEYTCYKCTYS